LFARFTRTVIKWVAFGLGAYFTYLQVKDIRADVILTPVASDLLWRSSLVIYYWCWIFGSYFDTNIQELAYASFPGKGKWPVQAFGALFLLVLVAGALLGAQGNITYFSLALAAFVTVDHLLWFYLKHVLKDSARDSRAEYKKGHRYYDLEILNAVDYQVQGPWKYRRLVAGATIVLVINLFAFSQIFRGFFVQAVELAAPWLSVQDATNLAYSLLVLLFVGVMEVWHWFMRFSTTMELKVLNTLSENYELTPR
jgi:hypothetical protein